MCTVYMVTCFDLSPSRLILDRWGQDQNCVEQKELGHRTWSTLDDETVKAYTVWFTNNRTLDNPVLIWTRVNVCDRDERLCSASFLVSRFAGITCQRGPKRLVMITQTFFHGSLCHSQHVQVDATPVLTEHLVLFPFQLKLWMIHWSLYRVYR